MEKIEDESFGIIPLSQENGRWKVFLILHKEGHHWGFPKGHLHEKETPLEAARRELVEETGLEVARILRETPFIDQYQFRRKGHLVIKRVHYFPALVVGTVALQEDEIRDGRWLTCEEGLKQLTFKEGRKILTNVMQELNIST